MDRSLQWMLFSRAGTCAATGVPGPAWWQSTGRLISSSSAIFRRLLAACPAVAAAANDDESSAAPTSIPPEAFRWMKNGSVSAALLASGSHCVSHSAACWFGVFDSSQKTVRPEMRPSTKLPWSAACAAGQTCASVTVPRRIAKGASPSSWLATLRVNWMRPSEASRD